MRPGSFELTDVAVTASPRDFAQDAARSKHATGSVSSPSGLLSPLPSASGAERSGRSLPPEIAFLGPTGFAPGSLMAAQSEAKRLGVSPDRALLARGAISEEAFYQTLARSLGLPFVEKPTDLDVTHYKQAVRTGLATREERGVRQWFVAPEGAMLRRLMLDARGRSAMRGRLFVTTPTALTQSLHASAASAIANEASNGLTAVDPSLSAQYGMEHPRLLSGWLIVILLLLIVISPAVMGGLVTFLLSLLFATAIGVRMLMAAVPDGAPRQRGLQDDQLPIYTIVVAMYREAGVVANLVAALNRLDYPKARLDIKLVIEQDDRETLLALKALHMPFHFEIIIAPHGAPRTKPRALNVALPFARGSLLTVYDAEDEPEPDQLRRAAERFAHSSPRLACLQARLAIDNTGDGWLPKLFAIEYAALFDVMNPGLAVFNLPILLGGTSNHFRTRALREIGGWDAWNVTEDADLGLRLARRNFRVAALSSSTHEEAPARLGAWMGQRRRWMKGWMQTLLVHAQSPRRLMREIGLAHTSIALAMLGAGILGPLIGPFLLFQTIYDLATDRFFPETAWGVVPATLWTFVCLAGVTSTLWLTLVGMARRKLLDLWPWLLLLPAYYTLMSVAAWCALFELIRRPFHWQKTEHGLARSSRRTARP